MKWKIEYLKSTIKTVKKLDPQTRNRLKQFIEVEIANYEDARQTGKPLKGTNLWRYRMGNFRVIAQIHDETITILIVKIGHRKDVYK